MEKSADTLQHRSPTTRNSGFSSFKTRGPIQFSSRWTRDALIQATLDPEIDVVTACPLPQNCPPDAKLAQMLKVGGIAQMQILCERSGGELPAVAHACSATCTPKHQILSEPDLTISRSIWGTRHQHLPALEIVGISARLRASRDGVAVATFGPKAPLVLAMACVGMVDLQWRGLPFEQVTAQLRAPRRLSTDNVQKPLRLQHS